MKKTKYLIVDTNVPLKAKDTHNRGEVDRKCALACLNFIKKLMDSDDVVVIDSGWEILNEYKGKISFQSEDNIATLFLKWIYQQRNKGAVAEYKITKNGDTYIEFPDSCELAEFDRSDRKFVALANAHPEHPSIYNGSDTDWWNFRDQLERNGIHVVFLCEDYMRAKCKR